jgi:hypothetical protein
LGREIYGRIGDNVGMRLRNGDLTCCSCALQLSDTGEEQVEIDFGCLVVLDRPRRRHGPLRRSSFRQVLNLSKRSYI